MLARVQTWLNRVADWVGGEDPAKAYNAARLIGPHEFRGPTLTFANGKSLTLAADIVQVRQADRVRLMVLTAKPPPGAVDQRNLFCVDGQASWGWACGDDPSTGHYTSMELEADRLAVTTDKGWRLELGISDGRVINQWRIEDGPRYRVAGSVLTFTGGRAVDFGSRILETFEAVPLVVVRTGRGPDDSPAENVVAVDHDGRIAWRIPRHGFANSVRPIPYDNAFPFKGRVRVTGQPGHFLDLDPATGAILHAEVNYR